jgi:molybdopterin-binding protein
MSARNHLEGEITDVLLGTGTALITVKVGDNLVESVITKRSAEELALKKGDKVTAVIKATEVMIQKDWEVPPCWSGRLRAAAVTYVSLVALAFIASRPAHAQTALPLNATLHVTGKVERPLALSEADLQALPSKPLAVTDEKGTPVVYDGVPVVELLRRAGEALGKQLRGPQMKLYVTADAADGYRVVFAHSPMLPMLAKRIDELPAGQTWIIEPNWDRFRRVDLPRPGRNPYSEPRCEIAESILSRVTRAPECAAARSMRSRRRNRCRKERGLDFEELQLRIHPAASRVRLLSREPLHGPGPI